MKKRFLALTLAGLLGASALLPAFAAEAQVSGWAEDYVETARDRGWVSDLDFDGDYTQDITRERFCQVLGNLLIKARDTLHLTVPYVPYDTNATPFTDVLSSNVSTVYLAGLIDGKAEGIFAPDDLITREEAAALLYRLAKYLKVYDPEGTPEPWTDGTEISDWAKDAVDKMELMDVMRGMGDGSFAPQGTLTAEQALAALVRLYDYALDEEHAAPLETREQVIERYQVNHLGDVIERFDTEDYSFLYMRASAFMTRTQYLLLVRADGRYHDYGTEFKSVSLHGGVTFDNLRIDRENEKVYFRYDTDYVIDLKTGEMQKIQP